MVRLVQHDEIRLWWRSLKERYGPNIVLMEGPVCLHDLSEQMAARCDPIDAERPSPSILQSMNGLQRHIGLPRPDWGFQHDGRHTLLCKPRDAGCNRLFLIGSMLPRHQLVSRSKSIPFK